MKESCEFHSDNYKEQEKNQYPDDDTKEEALKPLKKERDRCNRRHAMVGLEYTSLILNLVIGFICFLLGLLNYLNLGNIGKIAGLIGLGGGAVGFVLTLVYVIESGLVFNDRDWGENLKLDSDGAVLEYEDSKSTYTCIFYDKDNEDSIYLKFSNYGNKYLSYDKDAFFSTEDKYNACNLAVYIPSLEGDINWASSPWNIDDWYAKCKNIDEEKILYYLPKVSNCNKMYYISKTTDNQKKIIFDKWLTSIIFSCLIFLFDIGLALFGFLLFRESNGSSGAVSIK